MTSGGRRLPERILLHQTVGLVVVTGLPGAGEEKLERLLHCVGVGGVQTVTT